MKFRLPFFLRISSDNKSREIFALASAISRIRKGKFDDDDWLFIARSEGPLSGGLDAGLGPIEIDEDTDDLLEIIPPEFAASGLSSPIDCSTVKDCIDWADQLSGSHDDKAVLTVLDYYLKYDAVPESLDAPDPLPNEEHQLMLDREFYDLLGEENPNRTCKHNGCRRGSISVSIFCKTHHFESIQQWACPFND